jgi:hypothetical protein
MPNSSVWVVYGCAGEYSDFSVWLLGVFSEEQAAQICKVKAQQAHVAFCDKLPTWEQQHETHERGCPLAEHVLGTTSNQPCDGLILHHPDGNYDSVQYKVVELPFDQLDLLDPFRKEMNRWGNLDAK